MIVAWMHNLLLHSFPIVDKGGNSPQASPFLEFPHGQIGKDIFATSWRQPVCKWQNAIWRNEGTVFSYTISSYPSSFSNTTFHPFCIPLFPTCPSWDKNEVTLARALALLLILRGFKLKQNQDTNDTLQLILD